MKQKKILIIDDDDAIRGMLVDLLESEGFDTVSATDGRSGLMVAESSHPDLIILDIELPDTTGYDICKQIRMHTTLAHTPVIMLTAHGLEKEELRGFNSGADDYILKPFRSSRLLARISSAIGRNHRELDANSLTHLPGNKSILEEIQKRIDASSPYAILYFDLNNFKAFNDRYGFVRGDGAIKETAGILSNVFSAFDPGQAFLGHVGGDDFVGIVNSHTVEALCDTIIRRFDSRIPALYDEEDRRCGMIVTVDRKGERATFPLMGLAIAVITNRQRNFSHPGEVALVAGDLKKWVKSAGRSAYAVDRRTE